MFKVNNKNTRKYHGEKSQGRNLTTFASFLLQAVCFLTIRDI